MQSNTNWNLYKYFCAVYETRNFHRAADEFGVSHSAVSQNIRTLADQLGAPLFISGRSGVTPTPDADKLYTSIKRVAEIINDIEGQIGTLDASTTATIKMAVNGWFAHQYLDAYLKQFRATYPNVQIIVLPPESPADFTIDWDCALDNPAYKTLNLLPTPTQSVFIASRDYVERHNLGAQITLDQLCAHPIIERELGFQTYWDKNGVKFKNKIIVGTADQILPMVKSGTGIGVYNEQSLRTLADPNITEIRVTNLKLPTARMVCAYKSLSKPARAFLSGLSKFCK